MGHGWRAAQAARQARMKALKAAFFECSPAPPVTPKAEDHAANKDGLSLGDLPLDLPCNRRDANPRKRPGAAHPGRGRTISAGNILRLSIGSIESLPDEDEELGIYEDDGSSSEDSLSARTVTDQSAAAGPLEEDSPRNKEKVSRPTSSSSGKGVADATDDVGEKGGPSPNNSTDTLSTCNDLNDCTPNK